MKKYFFSLAVILISCVANAQAIPNGNMENWNSPTGFYDDPTSWGTDNILSQFALGGNPPSCFKDSVNPHSGNYCARLESIALTSNPASGSIPDTLGVMWTGSVSITNVTYGYPSIARPSTFSWWDHYTAMAAGDSGFVAVVLTHWNGSSTDTIAAALKTIYNTTNWTQYNSNFFYNPLFPNTVVPDTAVILVSATDDNFPRPGSTLWIDDLSFTGWVGVNEFANENSVSVFPNPSTTQTNFEVNDKDATEILIFDVTGQEIKREKINSSKISIDSSILPSGIYSFAIISKANKILSRGKFIVAQ